MKETDKLSLFFSNEFPFNKEGLEDFVNTFVIKSYKKGEIILENGNTDHELRFLDQGIIREYYATTDKEKNINFFTNPDFITDFSSFTHSTATKKYQECLTDVDLRVLSKEIFSTFTNQYNCGKLLVETIFQKIVINKETEEFNHFVNTAEELYPIARICNPCHKTNHKKSDITVAFLFILLRYSRLRLLIVRLFFRNLYQFVRYFEWYLFLLQKVLQLIKKYLL